MSMDQHRADIIRQYGPAPTSPLEALTHVVRIYEGVSDDRVMVSATSGIYGNGVQTGLTLGDLRSLRARLSAPADTGTGSPVTPEIWGGDPLHEHTWTWAEDDGNGHMGYTCSCTAFRL